MGQFYSAVEGDPLSGHPDSYVMGSESTFLIEDDKGQNRRMAFVGDNAYCAKCKSVGTIIGGAGCDQGARVYEEGRWQAVGGDFVKCQCDINPVIWPCYGMDWIIFDTPSAPRAASMSSASSYANAGEDTGFDELIVLRDEDGRPVPNQRFRITTADGGAFEGITNDSGETVRVRTDSPIQIRIELLV